jgi:HEAT repeat protein
MTDVIAHFHWVSATMSARKAISRLIRELGDPRLGNHALLALLTKGDEAVPALAEFLRSSKPSSLPEPRLLAVEGLSILKGPEALEALMEVASEKLGEIPDPAVRFAEEKVASRAARTLADFPDEPRARETLLSLLDQKPLTGTAEAFEKVQDFRAIPRLVEWLEEDFVADAAWRAIVACGTASVPALLSSLREKYERYGTETGMSQRRRARILSILCELATQESVAGLEDLLDDPVDSVRWHAIRLLLEKGGVAQQRNALQGAIEFLDSSDSFTRSECEDLLLAHFDRGWKLIEKEIHRRESLGESDKNLEPRETTLAILLRILRRGNKANRETGRKA